MYPADFVAVTFEEKDYLKKFLETHPFLFSQFTMDRSVINKLELARGYPTTILVVDGKIVYKSHGGPTENSKFFKERMELKYDSYVDLIKSHLQ